MVSIRVDFPEGSALEQIVSASCFKGNITSVTRMLLWKDLSRATEAIFDKFSTIDGVSVTGAAQGAIIALKPRQATSR